MGVFQGTGIPIKSPSLQPQFCPLALHHGSQVVCLDHPPPEQSPASVSGRLDGPGHVEGTLCQAKGFGPPSMRRARLACESGKIRAHSTACVCLVGIHYNLVSFTAHPTLEKWIMVIQGANLSPKFHPFLLSYGSPSSGSSSVNPAWSH